MAGLSLPRFTALLLNVALIVVPAGFGWSWLWLRQDAEAILGLGVFLAGVISVYRWGQRRAKGRRATPCREAVIAAVVRFAALPAALAYGLLLSYYTPVYLAVAAVVVAQGGYQAARSLRRRFVAPATEAPAPVVTSVLEVVR